MLKNFYKENELEVGMDESGCGPMCGDLYVAAVILPPECPDGCEEFWDMLNDSKKLSEKKRNLLFDFITEIAIDYSIVNITPKEIDRDNIWQSRVNGFHQALDSLMLIPTHIIVDGTAFRQYIDKEENFVSHTCINKGDTKYKSIAAASILAKVSRDRVIVKLHNEYPQYNWIKNKNLLNDIDIDGVKNEDKNSIKEMINILISFNAKYSKPNFTKNILGESTEVRDILKDLWDNYYIMIIKWSRVLFELSGKMKGDEAFVIDDSIKTFLFGNQFVKSNK